MELTAKPESVGLSTERLQRIRPWMERYVGEGRLPGATTLVARHGQVVYCQSVGLSDVEQKTPMTAESILRFYSMSKPVTAVAVLMLYEQGFFQLDDPLGEFIPGFKDARVYVSGTGAEMRTEPAAGPVTIHHLLCHTAGLTYGLDNEGPVAALYRRRRTDFGPRDGTLAEVVGRLQQIPLEFEPGSRWNYSVSFDVLGRLVEVVSGLNYDQFLKQRILGPLGMKDTGFTVPAAGAHRFAALYQHTADNGMALNESPSSSPMIDSVQTFSGGGGLVSTLGDYFRFSELLRRKGEVDGVRLLGRKTVELMTSNHMPGDLAAVGQPTFNETSYEGIGFGLGVSVMLDPARARILGTPGEYAWGGAASTAFWIDPLEDMTVIFLTQLLPSSAYPIRRQLKVLSYQALVG